MGEALRFGPKNGFSSRNQSSVPGNPGTSPSEPGESHPAVAIAGRMLSVRPQAFTPGSARIPNYKLSTKTGQTQTTARHGILARRPLVAAEGGFWVACGARTFPPTDAPSPVTAAAVGTEI